MSEHDTQQTPGARVNWAFASEWPVILGVFDLRTLVLWFAAILIPPLFWVALGLQIFFIIANIRKMQPEDLLRSFQMKRKSATPYWRRIHSIALLAVVAFAGSPAVEAEFQIIDGSQGAWKSLSEAKANAGGDTAYANPTIEDDGNGVPLSIALQQILPETWSVYYGDPDLKDIEVSWKGGRTMVDVLSLLADDKLLAMEADFDRERLYVDASNKGGGLKLAGKHVSSLQANPSQGWRLRKGEMLSDAVSRWAQRSNYNLVWQLPVDYPIVSDTTFEGSFRDAVQQVSDSYQQQGAMKTVEWVFKRRNQTLVVREYDRHVTPQGNSGQQPESKK